MREWKKQGAPGQKIMVGMPMYGRSFTLKNTSMFDIGSEVMGGGHAGRYTREEGFMAYYEVSGGDKSDMMCCGYSLWLCHHLCSVSVHVIMINVAQGQVCSPSVC